MRDPASLPTLLQSFFTTRLMTQRKVSPHTVASYRDTFRLLLQFAQKRLHKAPSQLGLDDLDASLVGAFLEDLENRRHNGARSRNLRLTAIRHAAAMELLQGGVDRAVIALWLGHESVETTQIYLDADLALKEQALAKTNPVKGAPKRFQPDDELLAFLKQL
jgi:site-specific recombinase XerD